MKTIANTSYINKLLGRAMRSADVKNAINNYKTGLFGVGEIRVFVYNKCVSLVCKDGKFYDMIAADWEELRNEIMGKVL